MCLYVSLSVCLSTRVFLNIETCFSITRYLLTDSDHRPKIKLCPRGAQTCALPLFCDRDLEMNLKIRK